MGRGAFTLEERQQTVPSRHELVRVVTAGICGTDLAITSEPPELEIPLPAVLGHEIFGIVDEGPNAGRHVIVDPNLHCGRCAMCLRHMPTQCLSFEAIGLHHQGGFADLVPVPADRLLPIENTVPARSAVLVEPLACVLHGLSRLPTFPVDGPVVILGAGPIGSLFALILERVYGRQVIVSEPSAVRRDALGHRLEHGSTIETDALRATVENATGGRGVSVVIDAVGSLLDVAAGVCAGRGTILAFGLADRPISTTFQQRLTWREMTVVSALTGGGHFPAAVTLIEQGVVTSDDLVTGIYPLEGISEAFSEARSGSGLKVLIEPGAR